MTRLTRRQFLGTTAAGALAAPHIWVRPAWAQQKQLSVLCWSHFVPAYDKWYDQWAAEWAGQEQRQGHDRSHSAPEPGQKIAAEIATQSGHDIVQLVGSGTEKFAPALIDVQDLAEKLGKKYGGWTPLAKNYSEVKGRYALDPRLLHRLPRPVPQGSMDRDAACRTARTPGKTCGRRREAEGQGLPDRHRPGAPQRLPQLVAGDPVVLRRLRGGQGRQDADLQLQGDARGSQVPQGALQGDDDAEVWRGTTPPTTACWPPAAARGSTTRSAPTGRSRGRTRSWRTRSSSSSRRGARPGGCSYANCLAYGITKFSPNQDVAKQYPGESDRQLPGGVQGQHRVRQPILEDVRQGSAADHQRGPEAQAAREVARVPLHHRLPGPAARRPRTRSTSSS